MSKIIPFPAAPTETTIDKAYAALAAANRARAAAETAAAQDAQEEAAAYTPEAFAAIVAYLDARQQPTQNADGVHVGDIYYSAWGYDQTNVDFYQVVALKGKHTAVIRQIANDYLGGCKMQGMVRPRRNVFEGEATRTIRTAAPRLDGHALFPTDDFREIAYSGYA